MKFRRFLAGILIFAVAQMGSAQTGFARDYHYTIVASSNNPRQSQAFLDLEVPTIDNRGVVVFGGSYNCDRPVPCNAVWRAAVNAPPQLASTANATTFFYDNVQINDSDTISAEFFFTRADLGLVDQIIEGKSRALRLVSPQAGNRRFIAPQLLENGDVAFYDGDTGHDAVLIGGRIAPLPSVACVYDQGIDASPNGFVAFLGSKLVAGECPGPETIYVTSIKGGLVKRLDSGKRYGRFTAVGVANSASVVFAARNLPNRPGHVAGLFRQSATGLITALSEIDNGACGQIPPVDATCQWRDYSWPLAVNAHGDVAATVEIDDWKQGKLEQGRTGVAVNGDIDAGRVAWQGMAIGDCPVDDAFAGRRSINDSGQIAIRVTCGTHDDAWTEIVIASPTK